MKYSSIIFIITLIFTGCSTKQTVVRESDSDVEGTINYSRLNEEIEGMKAKLVLVDGRVFAAENVRVGADTTEFTDQVQPRLKHIPTRDIVKIETRSHSQGAFDGLFWGLVGGGLFGYGLGETLTADVSRESTHGLAMFVMTAGSALLGTVGGVTYGAIHGHAAEYTLIQK